jgi:hypothetical protein
MNLTLTNNFYTWMRTILLQTYVNISSGTTTAYGHSSTTETPVGVIKDIEGVEHTYISVGGTSYIPYTATLNAWSSGSTTVDGYTYFGIGGNNTEPTADDYCLSSYTLGTDYSASWRALNNPIMVNDKGQLAFSISITAINDMVVGEVGMFKFIRGDGNRPTSFLLGRAALGTPISLSAGESATFQITIEL